MQLYLYNTNNSLLWPGQVCNELCSTLKVDSTVFKYNITVTKTGV